MVQQSGRRLALVALLVAALWAGFVALGAAHGFWRPPLAPRGEISAFRSRWFSSSSSFKRRTWSDFRPPYSWRHR